MSGKLAVEGLLVSLLQDFGGGLFVVALADRDNGHFHTEIGGKLDTGAESFVGFGAAIVGEQDVFDRAKTVGGHQAWLD